MLWNFGVWGYLSFVVVMGATVWGFMHVRKRPLGGSLMLALMVGWMWMPSGVSLDLPMIPAMAPGIQVALAAFIAVLVYHGGRIRQAKLIRYIPILTLCVISAIGTYRNNTDSVVYGGLVLPGMTTWDIVNFTIEYMLTMLIPIALGLAAFRTRTDAIAGLYAMCLAGLAYAPLVYYEIKMAPVLQERIFGFRPFMSFLQAVRDGGFRPQVFMSHGLSLATAWCVIQVAVAALYRIKKPRIWRLPTGTALVFFLVTQVLIKAKAALAMSLLTIPLVLWAKPVHIARMSMIIAVCSFVYPVLHMTGNFPDEKISEYLEPFGAERVESMRFRFDNEIVMTEHAMKRPWFGWGGFGRDRIYDVNTGNSLVVQDGYWIITLGVRGVFGYLLLYGLYTWPLFVIWWRFEVLKDPRDQIITGAYAIMTAIMVFNSIPNMAMNVMPYTLGAAVLALLQTLPAQEKRERLATAEAKQQRRAARALAATDAGDARPSEPAPAAQ